MDLVHINDAINAWVLGAAEAWWVLPMVLLLCAVDGFFPVVPSESLIVALASIWAGLGFWPVVALALVGSVGAMIGDQIAYRLGRAAGSRGYAWLRRPRVVRMVQAAERQLEHRGALLIFTARYVPIGRVAVNFAAGATGFSWRRFTCFDALGCLVWGAYSVGIGALAGNWMAHNKLLSIVVSVVIAIVLGWLLDQIIHRLILRFRTPLPRTEVTLEPRVTVPESERGRDGDVAA